MRWYLKLLIMFLVIFLIVFLVKKEIIPFSIYLLFFILAALGTGFGGLIFRIPSRRVNHSNSKNFNYEDIIVYLFSLTIGIIMAVAWFDVFME